MRMLLALAPLLLAAAVPVAEASGGLNWIDCASGAAQLETDFDCDANAGFADLVVSFVAPPGITALARVEARVRITSYHCATLWPFACESAFAPWWQVYGADACRSGAVEPLVAPTGACAPPWCGAAGAAALIAFETPMAGFRDLVAESRPAAGGACALAAGTEYAAMTLRVHYDRTTGAGACAGCDGAMGLTLQSLTLVMGDGSPDVVLAQAGGVLWNQRGAVPARRPTWGALKSTYR